MKILYHYMSLHISPPMPFSTVSGISASASSSSSTPVLFRHVCHANHSANEKYTGSNLYISMHLLWNLSNTCANSSVSLSMYRSWNSTVFYSKIFPDSFCVIVLRICDVFHCQIAVDFFLVWKYFVESLPTIPVMWTKTFPQH